MPVEQGIVLYIQAGLGSPPIAPGGWAGELPQNILGTSTPMAWAYKTITAEPTYCLNVQDGWTALEIQIDCHGITAPLAQQLMYAIKGILRGEPKPVFADSDATVTQGIFDKGTNLLGYSDITRSWVRTLEYLVLYQADT
jgi:hypothetical protein